MKRKLYLLLFATVIGGGASKLQAQISKGTNLVGGSIGFGNQQSNISSGQLSDDKSSSFIFTPSYGKAIRQNLIVGGDINILLGNTKYVRPNNTQTLEQNSYGLGVFTRHYRNLGQSGFYLFVQNRLGANIVDGKNENTASNSNSKTKGFNVRLNVYPGIAYAVTPKFHIETGLTNLLYVDYSNNKTTYNGGSDRQKSSGFSAGASVGQNTEWSVGFRILFGS